MEWPDKSSIAFTSVLGNLDTRVDLDKSIENNDRRYSISLSMMAAKLSYENQNFVQSVVRDHWKVKFSITATGKGWPHCITNNVFIFVLAQMEFLAFYNLWNGMAKLPFLLYICSFNFCNVVQGADDDPLQFVPLFCFYILIHIEHRFDPILTTTFADCGYIC